MVDTIVKRFLKEKNNSREQNTLKIEVAENPIQKTGVQGFKHLMIAKFQVGGKEDCEENDTEKEVLVKVLRLRGKQD